MWLTDLIRTNDEFVLRSGQTSNFYIDFRALYNNPQRLKQLSLEMAGLMRATYNQLDPDIGVCGLPYAAIPLATLVAIVAKQPLLLLRKEQKGHGTAKMVEGEAKKCFLIDDVFTTGSSLLSAREELERAGVEVLGAFVVFARGEAQLPFPVHALYDQVDLDGEARLRRYITNKGRLCFAADTVEALNMLEVAAPHICMLKLHGDILGENKLWLKTMSIKYNFAILEDRKLADIGIINQRQIDEYWHCDYVTAHAIMGRESVMAIKKHVFLIAQGSPKDALFSPEYTNACLGMARELPNVVGLIAQQKYDDLLVAQPGIHLHSSSDSCGQTYTNQVSGDIAIVGRGIYQAEDPLQAILEYKF